MNANDQFMLALTAWRENRGGGTQGMQSVMNVILNRCKTHNISPYLACIQRWQFSSITAPGDSQTTLWPQEIDPEWADAQRMASLAVAGSLTDITGGATFYYAKSMKTLPIWAATKIHTVDIEGQAFFK